MLQDKKYKFLIGFTVVLFLIIPIFYTTVTAQPVNVDDVTKMVDDWESKVLQNGQWIHVIYSVNLLEPSGIILPDGQPMPSSYINDDWYYVNQAGLVEKGVFSMKDNSGNILQQSAFQNNTIINFTFDDRQDDQQFYPLSIDLGFKDRITEATNKGITITKSNESMEGKPSITFSYTEKLKLPTQLGNENVVVDSIIQKGSFDEETGDFLQIQTIWILNDGTEIVYETSHIISIESLSDTNNEITRILEAVK